MFPARITAEGFAVVAGCLRSGESDLGETVVVAVAGDLPTVTFVVVCLAAGDALRECVASIEKQAYPRELVEVVVVDNSSDAHVAAALAESNVQVIVSGGNVGFAAALNRAAAEASSRCLALVNDDACLSPSWLAEMVGAWDEDDGYACVGGVVLDRAGQHVDFVGGTVNWHGMGNQIGYGLPVADVAVTDRCDIPFANGAAMLVSRNVFRDLGGFDPAYFAYFEDVDFGWRLWLAGWRVRLAAKAVAYHRQHGTAARLRPQELTVLFERNALRTLIKNVDGRHLGPLLAGAMLALLERARLDSGSDRRAYDPGAGETSAVEHVSRHTVARLHAVGDVLADLEALSQERARVQQTRRRGDEEIFALFGRPFEPLGRADEPYLLSWRAILKYLDIHTIFGKERGRRVVVVAYDSIGEQMAGPAIRSWEIACALARHVPVTVASEVPIHRTASNVHTVVVTGEDDLLRACECADVVLAQPHALRRYPCLASVPGVLVLDLYDPWIFENLEFYRSLDRNADVLVHRDLDALTKGLDTGDFFICASERQRDYWLGMLVARNRITRRHYRSDDELRSLIDVVPYGCPNTAPSAGLNTRRRTVVWTGGMWPWFDPLTVVDAIALARRTVPDIHLLALGVEYPYPGDGGTSLAAVVRQRIADLGLEDHVTLKDWTPYDQRGSTLAAAEIAVVATKPLAERRLAFRSRIVDHYWAGLPTVTTDGDVLAEEIAAHGAGIVVPCKDAAALADAMCRLLLDDQLRSDAASAARRLAERYRWSAVIEPLVRLAEQPWQWLSRREARRVDPLLSEGADLLLSKREEQIRDLSRELTATRARLDQLRRYGRHIAPAYRAAKRLRRGLRKRLDRPAQKT
jgi:GT2 family glycosyltransferase/glycosyltransferase involved in cell wall biosynthesis